MTNPTLEKVARALARTNDDEEAWRMYLPSAAVALNALRQVDARTLCEMVLAFRMDRSPTEAMGDAWAAAIDHILGQEP